MKTKVSPEKKFWPTAATPCARRGHAHTPARARSRWNALKHGLLSSEVVIRSGEVPERARELDQLLAGLRQDLQPRSALEELLVEKIAVCYWRLRRVLRCEAGEIRRGLEAAKQGVQDREVREATAAGHLLSSGATAAARLKLTRRSWGLNYLLGVLQVVRKDVEQHGHLPRQAYEQLRKHFGDEEDGLAARCLRLGAPDSKAAEKATQARQQDATSADSTTSAHTNGGAVQQLPPEPSGPHARLRAKSRNAILELLKEESAKLEHQRRSRELERDVRLGRPPGEPQPALRGSAQEIRALRGQPGARPAPLHPSVKAVAQVGG